MSFWKKKPEPESSAIPGKTTPEKKAGETPLVLGKALEGVTSEKRGSDLADDVVSPGKGATDRAGAIEMSRDDLLNERFGKTRSALSAGTVIQGKLSFDTPVRIDGKLSGEVYSSRALIIGPTGQVDAQIEVACLIVLGSLKGNAKVTERLEIWSGGSFDGDVVTPTLVVQEGGLFSGDCKMLSAQKKSENSKSEYNKSEYSKSEYNKSENRGAEA